MNPRRYPRTLDEAFPRTAAYAACITVGKLPWWERVAMWFGRFFT